MAQFYRESSSPSTFTAPQTELFNARRYVRHVCRPQMLRSTRQRHDASAQLSNSGGVVGCGGVAGVAV